MMVVQDKAKHYLLLALKVCILIITFGYIYYKLIQGQGQLSSDYIKSIINLDTSTFLLVSSFIGLACCNLFFEVLKWQQIVSSRLPITIKESLQQTLASLTVSLATPNRIGEYGAKAYYFKKEDRKTILIYTLFTNSYQMLITVILGILGWSIFWFQYNFQPFFYKVLLWGGIVCIVIVFAIVFRKKTMFFKGLSLQNILKKHRELTLLVKQKLVLFSILRYLCFGLLFYFLLQFYGAKIDFTTCIPLIFTMYLLASVVPTIFLFDVVVKGGIAIWLFSFAGVSEIVIISTVLTMWILNFVLPSILGAYYLMNYKPKYS